jgi:hypothetical protein
MTQQRAVLTFSLPLNPGVNRKPAGNTSSNASYARPRKACSLAVELPP